MTSALLDRVAAGSTLAEAWRRVRASSAAAGVDRVTPKRFEDGASAHLAALSGALRDGSYRPKPARRLYLPECPGRPVALSCVADRVVQRALADVLGRDLDQALSVHTFGFRKGRGVRDALGAAEAHLAAGRQHVVRTDVEAYFERVDRAGLLADLGARGVPDDVCRVVRRLLAAGCVTGAARGDTGVGIQQGSPLSPLLANLWLAPVDAALERGGHVCLRYADDLLILADSAARAADALALLRDLLGGRGLALSSRKTRQTHAGAGFGWLGMWFDPSGSRLDGRAWSALGRRADDAETVAELAAIGSTWTRWYGDLDPTAAPSLAALACLALAGASDAKRRVACAGARVGQPGPAAYPTHLALMEVWRLVDGDLGAAVEALDLCAAARAGAPVEALCEAGGIRPEVAALLHDDPQAAAALAVRDGRARLARGLRLAAARRAVPVRDDGPQDDIAPWVHALVDAASTVWIRTRGRGGGWTPLEGTERDVAFTRHVAGEAVLGVDAVDRSGRGRVAVVRCVVRREERVPPWASADGGTARARARWEALTGVARTHAHRVADAAVHRGVPAWLEHEGSGATAVWLVLDDVVALRHLFALARQVQDAAGDPPPELRVTCWPPGDRLRRQAAVLALPLGVHARSGRRSTLVRHGATPSSGSRDRALAQHVRQPSPETTWRPPPEAEGRVRAVLDGCALLRAIAEKADRLGHLSGAERRSVVEALSHLRPRDEAVRGLAALLKPTGKSVDDVRRRVQRAPPAPISCPRLQERHGALRATCGEGCAFRGLRRGAWPTPILHAMRVDEVSAFRKPGVARAGGGTERRAASVQSAPSDQDTLRRLTRRYERALVDLRALSAHTLALEREMVRQLRAAGTDRVHLQGRTLVMVSEDPPRYVWVPTDDP